MLTLSIVASRYGSGILEDNFVARIYTSYDSGGQFLALYTVLNCYVYVLVFMFFLFILYIDMCVQGRAGGGRGDGGTYYMP